MASYLVSGRIYGKVSGIRPDLWQDIRYPAGFMAGYSVSGQIYGHISSIRPWYIVRYIVSSRNIWPDIRYPAWNMAIYKVPNSISGFWRNSGKFDEQKRKEQQWEKYKLENIMYSMYLWHWSMNLYNMLHLFTQSIEFYIFDLNLSWKDRCLNLSVQS